MNPTLNGRSRSLLLSRSLVASLVGLTATCAIAVACSSSDGPLAPADAAPIAPQDAQLPSSDAADAEDAADTARPDARDAMVGDAAPRECSAQGFCPTALPPDQKLSGVWGDGTGSVWAISETGRVLRWDGRAWALHVTLPGEPALLKIWGSGPTDVWILGAQGLLHGTGASSSSLVFAPVDAPGDPTIPLTALWGTGPQDVWAAGGTRGKSYPYPATGRLVHLTSEGWQVVPDVPTDVAFRHVWGTPAAGTWVEGMVAADSGGRAAARVLRLAAGSSTWEVQTLPPDPGVSPASSGIPGELTAAAMGSATSMWLVGQSAGGALGYWHGTSADAGRTFTWAFLPRPIWDLPLGAVWGTAPNDVWAAGDYGRLRHWDGTTWTQAALMVTSAPIVRRFSGLWGATSADFWIVGDDIAIRRTPGKP